MRIRIWLSFDLGVSGDYERMYMWLDDKGAKECGDSVASLMFTYDGDLLASLKSEIENAVSLNKRSRVYVVYRDHEGANKGRFVIGRRKNAPWDGYGTHEEPDDDEDY
jgi:hypothetical protein